MTLRLSLEIGLQCMLVTQWLVNQKKNSKVVCSASFKDLKAMLGKLERILDL